MAKRKSAYENEYTKQMEEAVFDQKGYDSKKAVQKQKVREANLRHKGLTRIFFGLIFLGIAVGAMQLINMDKDNAGPIAVFLALCGCVFALVRFINK